MTTVRVKFLRGTSLGNGLDAAAGEVVDLDRRLFAQFEQQGRVVEVPEPIAPAPALIEPTLADDGGTAGLPAPTKKGKKNV